MGQQRNPVQYLDGILFFIGKLFQGEKLNEVKSRKAKRLREALVGQQRNPVQYLDGILFFIRKLFQGEKFIAHLRDYLTLYSNLHFNQFYSFLGL